MLMPRYIDADALKSYLNNNEYADMYSIEAVFGIIDRQPAIGPESLRARGKWKWRSFNIACSICECEPYFDSTEPLYNYCPNCGAKMEVTDDA